MQFSQVIGLEYFRFTRHQVYTSVYTRDWGGKQDIPPSYPVICTTATSWRDRVHLGEYERFGKWPVVYLM